MKPFLTFCILAVSALCANAQLTVVEIGADGKAAETPLKQAANHSASGAKTDINYADALALGLVEGLTEYLPVSSTGHLIIANAALGLESEEPLTDKNGRAVLGKDLKPYTMKNAADAYAIVIQFGAILAVALVYRDYLLKMLAGLFGRNPVGLRLLRNIIAAFLPAAVVGLILHDAINGYLFGVKPVVAALAAGALLMFGVQKYYQKREQSRADFTRLEDLSLRQSLVVGVLQCMAMWPGTSRSMMTILGGYLAGMRPADSARFSFLLGLATLSAASLYKVYRDGAAMAETLSVGPLAFGMAVAFASAAASVKWLIGFLTRRGLAPFAWYRLALAAALGAMIYFDLIG